MSIKIKRHYPLVLTLILVIALLVTLLRDTRIVAYTVAGSLAVDEAVINYDSGVDLFDDTKVHEVVVLISAEDQQKMVATYRETERKDYFPADVIIDGVRVDHVGIRLKGNASLRNLDGRGERGPGGRRPAEFDRADMPDAPPDGARPDEPPPEFDRAEMPEAREVGEGEDAAQLNRVSYLIKFDEYENGQRYQGYAKIALRSSGIAYDAAQLQEPVSNAAFNHVGVPSVKTAYISLQFNAGTPTLYNVAEEPDQLYIDRLFPESNGVLYKVQQVGNKFRYKGEDPTRYDGIFSQETAKNDADLAPLIAFMRFVTESSDAEFARDLAQWFDVEAFAAYLAVNNLLVNIDSLAGMGNNYYLYYDFTAARFTILAWDTNESLGKLARRNGATLDLYWETVGAEFGALADATEDSSAAAPRQDERRTGRDGPIGGKNLLLSRFFATPQFVALYDEKLQEFYQKLFVADFLRAQAATYVELITAYNQTHELVAQPAYDAAVQQTLDFLEQRQTFLETTALLGL